MCPTIIVLMEKEKAKNSEYYKDAIETWTYRDDIKRNARMYNLNYIGCGKFYFNFYYHQL